MRRRRDAAEDEEVEKERGRNGGESYVQEEARRWRENKVQME